MIACSMWRVKETSEDERWQEDGDGVPAARARWLGSASTTTMDHQRGTSKITKVEGCTQWGASLSSQGRLWTLQRPTLQSLTELGRTLRVSCTHESKTTWRIKTNRHPSFFSLFCRFSQAQILLLWLLVGLWDNETGTTICRHTTTRHLNTS